MAKKRRAPDEYDNPWKGTLQLFLRHFLEFFFPDIDADIDWSRSYESLDIELQKIARRARIGNRLADKLFKVWLKDGGEHWLLIHIEVQSDFDAQFAERMFHCKCIIEMPQIEALTGLAEVRKFSRLLKKARTLHTVREYFD